MNKIIQIDYCNSWGYEWIATRLKMSFSTNIRVLLLNVWSLESLVRYRWVGFGEDIRNLYGQEEEKIRLIKRSKSYKWWKKWMKKSEWKMNDYMTNQWQKNPKHQRILFDRWLSHIFINKFLISLFLGHNTFLCTLSSYFLSLCMSHGILLHFWSLYLHASIHSGH